MGLYVGISLIMAYVVLWVMRRKGYGNPFLVAACMAELSWLNGTLGVAGAWRGEVDIPWAGMWVVLLVVDVRKAWKAFVAVRMHLRG